MRTALRRLGSNIKYVVKQTFRAHSSREYAEIFSRGRDRRERPLPCPWLYARSFVALLMMFTTVLCIMYFSKNRIPYPTAILFGGLLGNVPILLLFYELYPKRDFSLAKLGAVTLFGGVASILLAQAVYAFVHPADGWLSALMAGTLEEFTKVLVSVICLLIFRKRNPMFGFLIGAAVAAGFSISEDMGYIFSYSVFINGRYDISQVVALGIVRSLMSVCTHMAWTGIITWALCNFAKPYINVKFYAFLLLGMAMHMCWDFPLTGAAQAIVITLLTVSGIILQYAVIRSARAKCAYSCDGEEQLVIEMRGERRKANLSQAANVVGALCCVAVCILTLSVFYINMGERTTSRTFTDVDEYVNFMQDGIEVNCDFDRTYDARCPDWAFYVENGAKTQAVQRCLFADYTLDYYYDFTPLTTEDGFRESSLRYVRLIMDDATYTSDRLTVNGETVNYFILNDWVSSYGVTEEGVINVRLRTTYVYGALETVITASVAGGVALCGLAAFVILKIKARRNKNA